LLNKEQQSENVDKEIEEFNKKIEQEFSKRKNKDKALTELSNSVPTLDALSDLINGGVMS